MKKQIFKLAMNLIICIGLIAFLIALVSLILKGGI